MKNRERHHRMPNGKLVPVTKVIRVCTKCGRRFNKSRRKKCYCGGVIIKKVVKGND